MARNPHMSKAPPYSAAEIESIRLPGGATERGAVAVEELLEIRINGEPIAVTATARNWRSASALGRDSRLWGLLCQAISPRIVDVASEAFDVSCVKCNFHTSSSSGVCGRGRSKRSPSRRVASRMTSSSLQT
jgi:hypothetical protein